MNGTKSHSITLGMGCFWSPDALFGQLAGVIRTRVGYAGGTTEHPTYREMGDHSETVQIEYDPVRLSLEDLLELFWSSHKTININEYKGRQYQSLVLYHDADQLGVIERVLNDIEAQGEGRPDTEVAPLTAFYTAEERHQKYYLKRYPDAITKLASLYPSAEELTRATLAARLNGLAKGYTNLARVCEELRTWPVSEEDRERMIRLVKQIKW
jgi:peptide-methionine (S)-S-oxide reductase